MSPNAAETSRLRTCRRTAGWVVIAVAVFLVLALGGVYAWGYATATIILLLALGGTMVCYAMAKRSPPWHWLFVPVLMFGLQVVWQWWSGRSAYPADTLTGILQLAAGGAALYLSYVAFSAEGTLAILSTTLWIFTGLLSGYAIFQFFRFGPWVYGTTLLQGSTPVGPFFYHNHYAGAMDLLLPIAVAAAWRPPRGGRPDALRILRRSVCPALGLASVVVAQSRGGTFALALECAVALWITRSELRLRARLRVWAVAALGFSGFAALAGLAPMLHRMARLASHDPSASNRLAVARTCLAIWRDHLWFGSGFNTFPSVYPAYQRFDNGLQWMQAHNEYAQLLAETGIAGGAMAVAVIAILVWSQRTPPTGATPGWVAAFRRASFVGMVGFMFHSYGDFLFHAPADMVLFFVALGANLAAAKIRAKQGVRRARPGGRTADVALPMIGQIP